MAGRGKFRKQSKNVAKNRKNFAKPKRKTFSIFQGKTKDDQENPRNGNKRKFAKNSDVSPNGKKTKLQVPLQKDVQETSEDSEDEVPDHMKQLRATFGKSNRKFSQAFNDSEEEESEVEENQVEVEENEENKEENEEEDSTLDEEEENNIETNEVEVEDDSQDPFVSHLFYDLSESLLNSVQTSPMLVESHEEFWPNLGKIRIEIPQCEETNSQTAQFSLDSNVKFAEKGKVPRIIRPETNLSDLHVKSQIANHLSLANKVGKTVGDLPFSEFQCEMFAILNNYQDLYFPGRNFENAEEIRFLYCLHAINHVLKIRTKILHHNAKLNRKDDVPEEFRDQGLVRPKILIIVPFRDAAHKVVNTLLQILIPEDRGNVKGRMRFEDEFTGNELAMPKINRKPEDYERLFAGNTGDDFKIGLTINKKSVKLYADFYASDIIVASPLGLRCVIGAEGEPDRDYDFLASVEFLVLDQSEVFLVQNWDHVVHIFDHLHLQPKAAHGTDFGRVRTWSLNGQSRYYRQTLLLSSHPLPECNALFNRKCRNFGGKVRCLNGVERGSIRSVFVQLPHVFQRFEAGSVVEAIDARFEFFVRKVLPQQRDSLMRQSMVYVANYFDYVRLRNYFKREDIGFVQICEYSKEGKIARARDMFYHGDAHFLLYTERFHFFNRKQIKGIRHLIFYQPPNFPNFYYEMCNLMQEANMNKKIGNMSNMTVTVLYSKYDIHQLSGVVGTERAMKMMASEQNVHMLLTDG